MNSHFGAHFAHQNESFDSGVSGLVHPEGPSGAETQGKIADSFATGMNRIGTETAFLCLRNF
jgi:hypothetical protein